MAKLGQVVLAVAGAFAGVPLLGVTSLQGFLYGWTLGGMLFPRGQGQHTYGPRLDSLHVADSQYGNPIPIVWGAMRLGGQVIWADNIRETRHDTVQTVGKGNTVTQTNYTYSASFAVAFCAGPVTAIRRLWCDDRLVYDASVSNAGPITEAGHEFEFYPGSETQNPDPTIEAVVGVGNTPAYRGLCYVVFTDLQLALYGNRLPSVSAEVVTGGTISNTVVLDQSLSAFGTHVVTSGGVAYLTQHSADGLCIVQPDGSNVSHSLGAGSGPRGLCVFNNDLYIAEEDAGTVARCRMAPWAIYSHLAVDPNPYDVVQRLGYLAVSHNRTPGSVSICSAANGGTPFAYLYSISVGNNARHLASSTAYVWVATDAGLQKIGIPGGGGGEIPYGGSWSLLQTMVLPGGARPGALAVETAAHTYGHIWAIDETNNRLLGWRVVAGGSDVLEHTVTGFAAGLTDVVYCAASGTLWVSANGGKMLYEVGDDGTGTYVILQSEDLGGHHQFGGLAVESTTLWVLWGEAAGIYEVALGRIQVTQPALADIVTDLAEAAGLSAADLDLSEMGATSVPGFVVPERAEVRAVMEGALHVGQGYCAVESDGKIKFVSRAPGFSWIDIAEADLAAHEGEEIPALVEGSRVQEQDLPDGIDVRYINNTDDYEMGIEPVRRIGGNASRVDTLNIPFTSAPAVARSLGEELLYRAWVERVPYKLNLSRKWMLLDPGDCLRVTTTEATYYMRVTRVDYGSPGLVRVEAVAEAPALYDRPEITDGGGGGGGITPLGRSVLELFDNARAGYSGVTAGQVGFWLAGCGADASWPGCRVYRSVDNWATSELASYIAWPHTMGYASDALSAPADPDIWDEASSVTVELLAGTLTSHTAGEVLEGLNWAILGDEVIAFRTATLIAPNTYTLTGMLRGRCGTEWAMGTHAANDRFALFVASDYWLSWHEDPLTSVGRTYQYRAVTVGGNLDEAADIIFTNTGECLRPRAPVALRGVRDGVSGDWELTWIRRARTNYEWRDLVDVPLDETAECYYVRFLDAPGGNVVYTVIYYPVVGSDDPPALTLTAAEQTTHFGGLQDHLHVEIRQRSWQVGEGHALTGTVVA